MEVFKTQPMYNLLYLYYNYNNTIIKTRQIWMHSAYEKNKSLDKNKRNNSWVSTKSVSCSSWWSIDDYKWFSRHNL